MRYLIIILILFASCSPARRLSRICKKNPEICKSEKTVKDTIITFRDTIIRYESHIDSTFRLTVLDSIVFRDTSVGLDIWIKRLRSDIYRLKYDLKPDTIVVINTDTINTVTYKTKYEGSEIGKNDIVIRSWIVGIVVLALLFILAILKAILK